MATRTRPPTMGDQAGVHAEHIETALIQAEDALGRISRRWNPDRHGSLEYLHTCARRLREQADDLVSHLAGAIHAGGDR